jgi:hypothetical protein
LLGQLSPNLSHLYEDVAMMLGLGLACQALALLREFTILRRRFHLEKTRRMRGAFLAHDGHSLWNGLARERGSTMCRSNFRATFALHNTRCMSVRDNRRNTSSVSCHEMIGFDEVPIAIIGAALISSRSSNKKARAIDFVTGRSVMIGKSTIAATVLVTIGLASPAFAQVPPAYYYDYAGPYAYPYGPPAPYGWTPYGYGGWPGGYAASINYNVHTPPNH